MAKIQQAIDVNVPAHIAYQQLTRFEDYPRFMQDVEEVRQLDDGHLHWSACMAERHMEWDAEITEWQDGRCVAWHNLNGPKSAGKVELEPVGQNVVRVVLTMDCEPGQIIVPPDGNAAAALSRRLEQDLACLKQLMESAEHGAMQEARYAATAGVQAQQPVTSAPSLSLSSSDSDEDGRFSVAAEQNFDQQSDGARRVGRMPQDVGTGGQENPAEAMAKTLRPDGEAGGKLRESIERAVPRGD